jgi:hypothetical protein
MKSISRILLLSMVCTSASVNAEILQQDGFVSDTESSLDWLDARVTRNVSYNDVVAQMVPGGQFEGWRYATKTELVLLLHNMDVPHSADSACAPDDYCDFYGDTEPPAIAAAISMLGDTLLEFWESDPDDAFSYVGTGATIAMIEWPGFLVPQVARIWDSERYRTSNGTFVGDAEDSILLHYRSAGGFSGNSYTNSMGDRITGSLLVRESDPVPPAIEDIDEDGFPDLAELEGLDVDGDGVIDLDLPGLGADPCRKTMVVEIDFMDGADTGLSHVPHPAVINTLVDSFNDAPIAAAENCPYEGFPTQPQGVNFLGYVSQEIPEETGFYQTLNELPDTRESYFDQQLLPYVHYAVYAHALDTSGTTSGQCCNEGSFIVSLGNWSLETVPPSGSRVSFFDPAGDQDRRLVIEAGTLMHELGHALGLGHGGDDRVNFKPNYLSIMNYMFQTNGMLRVDDPAAIIIDYSQRLLPTLDETALDESLVLCVDADCPPLITAWDRNDLTNTIDFADTTMPIDWNFDGAIDDNPIMADINQGNTGKCVNGGNDNFLDTTPQNDDLIVDLDIVSGPDTVCDTTAATGDFQFASVGTQPDVIHTGFDDWSAIQFLAAENANGGGVTSYEVSDSTEIEEEEAVRLSSFWDGVRAQLNGAGTQPPVISGPLSLVLEGNDPFGWSGDYVTASGMTAEDPDGGPVSLTSDAPAMLPLGESSVAWLAIDDEGDSANLQQQVRVVDTTPPTLQIPDDLTVEATGPLTAVDIGTAQADDLYGAVISNNDPMQFPVGDTQVTWRAEDGNGNTTTEIQTISVLPLPDTDSDGVVDSQDNCPAIANADQADADGDGIGDACEAPEGRVCDADYDGDVDRDDIRAIARSSGQLVDAGDPRDLDSNGLINFRDVIRCALRCDRYFCR